MEFSILHASDLHLASTPDRPSPVYERIYNGEKVRELLRNDRIAALNFSIFPASYNASAARALARFLHAERQFEVDALVFSGDIATTARAADLQRARQYLFAESGRVPWLQVNREPTIDLERLRVPTILIPGNHDRFGFLHLPNCSRYDDVFPGSCAEPDRVVSLTLSKDGFILRLVGIDLSLDEYMVNYANMLGQGRAYSHRVAKLVEASKAIPEHDALVWVVHFPPESPSICEAMKLLDEQDLVCAALASNVRAILCGHTHEFASYRIADRLQIVTAGSALQHASSAPCEFSHYTLDFSREDIFVECNRYYFAETGSFELMLQ